MSCRPMPLLAHCRLLEAGHIVETGVANLEAGHSVAGHSVESSPARRTTGHKLNTTNVTQKSIHIQSHTTT